jgi:hypothetical protein
MAQINLAVEIYIGLFSTARKATKNNMDLFVTVLSLAVQKRFFSRDSECPNYQFLTGF